MKNGSGDADRQQAEGTLGAERRRTALGAVIRRARGTLPQAELGRRLGDVPQTTISRWESGTVELTCEQVYRIEETLDLPHGSIPRLAGFTSEAAATKEAFQVTTFDRFTELLDSLKAAETLGLGVRVQNAWAPHGDHQVCEWVLGLMVHAPWGEEEDHLPMPGTTPIDPSPK